MKVYTSLKLQRITTVIAVILSILTAACTEQTADNRQPMPSWYEAFERFEGVNLPQLEPEEDFKTFIHHPQFVQNLTAMGWNTFRLPVDWESYAEDNGDLKPELVATGRENLKALVAVLAQIYRQNHKPIFLIIDIHQYKFGSVCGGVGIPSKAIRTTGLDKEDPNCVFRAFDRFWKNDRNVLAKWAGFAREILKETPEIFEENKEWLTLGFEPINEPQFGFGSAVFDETSMYNTFMNLREATSTEVVQRQIDNYLVPFYRRFLNMLHTIPNMDKVLEKSLMVFEPYFLDHIMLEVPVRLHANLPEFNVSISTDGSYVGMLDLRKIPGTSKDVYWIAAPHHYIGALDNGFLSYVPSHFRRLLTRYPNNVIDAARIDMRMFWLKNRMAEAGMDTLIGEWGTETGLLQTNGSSGGYRTWITDSLASIGRYSKGALWWRYYRDASAGQEQMYLLTNKGIERGDTMAPNGPQNLKCGEGYDLVRLVFGHCGEARGL